MSAWGMLKQGNVIGAVERVWNTIMGDLPAPVAAFVKKILADEEGVLITAATAGAQQVIKGGISGVNIAAAADTVVSTLASKGVTVLAADAIAAVGTAVSYLQTQTPATT